MKSRRNPSEGGKRLHRFAMLFAKRTRLIASRLKRGTHSEQWASSSCRWMTLSRLPSGGRCGVSVV
jgi:hypothetical protein